MAICNESERTEAYFDAALEFGNAELNFSSLPMSVSVITFLVFLNFDAQSLITCWSDRSNFHLKSSAKPWLIMSNIFGHRKIFAGEE